MSDRIEWCNKDILLKVKGQLHSAKTPFLPSFNAGTEGEIGTVFHMWSDTELVSLILGVNLEAVGML